MNASLTTPGLSTRDRIIGAVLGGLGGGIASGLSDNYQSRAAQAYQDSALSGVTGSNIERPSVLTPSIFQSAQSQGKLFKTMNDIQAAQTDAKMNADIATENRKAAVQSSNEIKRDVIKGLLSSNPKEQAAARAMAQSLDLEVPEPQPIATPAEDVAAKPGKFGDGKTVQTKLEDSMQRFIEKGSSPSAAGDLAAKANSADLTQNKIAAKKVEDIRNKVSSLDSLIGTAKIGITGAGETGGSFATPRNAISKLMAFAGSNDQQAKQTAQSQLDTIKPDIVQSNKFAGAMSDRDIKLLVGAGPSSDQTPEANRAILANMEVARGRLNDYADFMDTFLAERGDLQGAEQLWDKYKTANPLVVEENGMAKLNPKITPWSEFDFSGKGTTAGTPSTATQPTQATVLQSIPPGYELTGNVDANGNQGIRKIQ